MSVPERQQGVASFRPAAELRPYRIPSLVAFGALCLFAFSIAGAVANYPGGTAFAPAHTGYDFWRNFWCDALRNPALNGAANQRGARLAGIALWTLGAGLLPFWRVAAHVSAPARASGLRAAIALGGIAGMAGLMGIVLLPSDRFPQAHGMLVTAAGPSGLLAAALAVGAGAAYRRVPAVLTLLGVTTLLLAAANLVQYSRQFWLQAPSSELLPLIQKLGSLSFLAWVVSIASLGFTRRSMPDSGG